MFRVWCLSWDETEENGMNVAQSPADEPMKSRDRYTLWRSPWQTHDARHAAEEYADFVHSQRDGYESSWPLDFRVRLPDGTTEDYEVEREVVPQFTAHKKKGSL